MAAATAGEGTESQRKGEEIKIEKVGKADTAFYPLAMSSFQGLLHRRECLQMEHLQKLANISEIFVPADLARLNMIFLVAM